MNSIGEAKELIRVLFHNLDTERSPGDPGILISRVGGSLFLTNGEADRYSETISSLRKDFGRHDDMSKRAVAQHLGNAIFSALDIRGVSTQDFETRLTESVKELRNVLEREPIKFTWYIPVGGLKDDELPRKFGDARFVILNKSRLEKVSSTFPREYDDRNRQHLRKTMQDFARTENWDGPALVIQVTARDLEASKHKATHRAVQIIDTLNFFTDLVPSINGWLYLPGEASRAMTSAVIHTSDEWISSFSVVGPYGMVSLKRLKAFPPLQPMLRRTQKLMCQPERKGLTDTILTSVEWAGRATVAKTREQAFLLFAIALETIALPSKYSGELAYRLSTRIPPLLTKDRARRTEMFSRLKKLYDIRSRIAHSGYYEVSEDDLGRIRGIAKNSIIRIATHRTIGKLRTNEELEAWFCTQMLR